LKKVKRIRWIGILAAVGLLLCSMSVFAETGKKVKWLTVKKAWVHFKVTGNRQGEIIRQYDEYGFKQSELNNTAMQMMGMNIAENKKVVIHGKMVTTQENDKPFATRTENPIYDSMVQRMNGTDGLEFGEKIAKSMGGKWNGVTRVVAKNRCREMENPQLGSKVCITKEGLAVRNEVNSFGMQFVEEATKIRLGYADPDAFIFPKNVEIREGPKLGGGSNFMSGFKNRGSRKSRGGKMPDMSQMPSGPQGGQERTPPNMEEMQNKMNELMKMFQPKN